MTTTTIEKSKVKSQIWLLSIGHFLNDFYCNFLPILIPILMIKLNLSLALSGILVMVMSLTSNVLQPVFGYIVDKHNFNRLISFIIPLGAIFICLTPLSNNFILLCLLIGLSGLAVSMFHPMGAGLVGKIAPMNKKSTALSIFVAGGNLGFALSPLLLVYFINHYNISYIPLLILPAIIAGFFIQSSGITKESFINKDDPTKQSISIREIFTYKNLLLLNLSMGLRAWVCTAITTYLPLWALGMGYDSTTSGFMLTVFLFGATAGGLLAGQLNDRYGYKIVMLWALALGIFPILYFLLVGNNSIFFYICLFLGGASVMAPNPGAIAWGQRFLPNNPGMASGMMLGLSFGLGGFGTMLTSYLGELTNLPLALIITSFMLLLSTIIVYITPEQ